MSKTERDPLFFPPAKYPDEGDEPEEYSAEIDPPAQQKGLRLVSVVALLLLAFILIGLRPAWLHPNWNRSRDNSTPALNDQFATMPPQRQAESLLHSALSGDPGAPGEIGQRAQAWQGNIYASPALLAEAGVALRSNDLNIRKAAVEVELAAYNLPRTEAAVQGLITRAESDPKARANTLGMIALIGSRGIAVDRSSEFLLSCLHDTQIEIRLRAGDALALLAAEDTVPALLESLHNDAAMEVRKRAADDLAHGGLLDQQQRMSAVPALLQYSTDSTLDAPTRALVFQTLREITSQSLPDDASTWQRWNDTRK